MDKVHWLLPEGIDEVVPPQAEKLEHVRRNILDLYSTWGYELVMPPFIEFLDSLLMGAGKDVDLKTFKVIDQVSGRLMGLRADMTTQVARIDAHHLDNEAPSRLCYMGTVLHTLPDGFGGSRAPLQIGAELYGHKGNASDIEVISLMLETFKVAGVEQISIDIGHVGIFRGLAAQAGLNGHQEAQLFEALQRKAVPEIKTFLDEFGVDADNARRILALSELNGSDVLEQARQALSGSSAAVMQAIDNIEAVAKGILRHHPQLALHYDLSELRGYNFHTGIVFSAYVADSGVEIARGGRYDNIGGEFGRARPATGFSSDLHKLLKYGSQQTHLHEQVIFAPCTDDLSEEMADQLLMKIAALRSQGTRVICQLNQQSGTAVEMGCTAQLTWQNDSWQVSPIN